MPSLSSVGLVGNLVHAPCVSVYSVGEPCRLWTIWVQWLSAGSGPYPSVAFIFFWREAINPPVTPDRYHWYDFTRVQLDEKNEFIWLVYTVQAQGY